MSDGKQAVSRHLVFVLEDGTPVVQRGATLVETLATHEKRSFTSFDHHHNITDAELRDLRQQGSVLDFDDATVWLPLAAQQQRGQVQYYFLDTRLALPYLKIVQSLLETTDLPKHYVAKAHANRVTITGAGGDPFTSLSDAESALMLLQNVLGKQLIGLSIESLTIDTSAEETQAKRQPWQQELISHKPATTLQDTAILIIESDAVQLARLEQALKTLQLRVHTAVTGEAALDIITDEEPDLVLIDLNLPDMHGYEVIAKIKKDPLMAGTPIITMSAHPSETDRVFALYVAKVEDYLTKPVDPRVIRQRVVNILSLTRL